MASSVRADAKPRGGHERAEAGPASPLHRWTELLFLFGVAPAVVTMFIRGWMVFPAIWMLALVAAVLLLRDRGFDRGELAGLPSLRRAWVGIALRAVMAAVVLVMALAAYNPSWLLALWRERPMLLALIVVGYPALSVYPQELAFRTFFRRRYRGLVRSESLYILLNASVFAYAHIILRTGAYLTVTVGLCFVAGLVLAWAYERHRSALAAWLEHALYGTAAFVIGWGPALYGGGFG